jgi:drug/metabolite transporter (DMT)-like permease
MLYRGLASGAMAVVAPITGVTGAALPVAVGLLTDAAPSAPTLVGVGCAVAAIGLVSLGSGSGRTDSDSTRRPASVRWRIVGSALLAGAVFGHFFVLFDQTAADSGLWPVAALRLGSIATGLMLVRIRREPMLPPRSAVPWLLVAGFGDIGANALYLIAAREGVLTVVAPVAALYPVSTVLLALVIDHERVRPIQVGGLGLAAAALVLTAL